MKLLIEKLVYGGDGMGEVDGKKIFVPFSAPEDVLDVDIVVDHGSWAEAKISKVIEPSSCRVNPKCRVFGRCGGCQWQHISYKSQLEWKACILEETLMRVGKISSPDVLPTIPCPNEWHYRNKIQLHVDSKGRAGFYKPRSKEVVEFEDCMIADTRLNEELNLKRCEIAKRSKGIKLTVSDEEGSFGQVNTVQNERLRGVVVEWLQEVSHLKMVELYAGSGNFTFALSKICGTILASDIDKRAIEAAKKRQLEENVCNVEFVCGDTCKVVKNIKNGCDVVLVDPPRSGCIDVIPFITAMKPKTILYVSCNPATLARDGEALLRDGYTLGKAQPVDMFPQTFHIETVSMWVSG